MNDAHGDGVRVSCLVEGVAQWGRGVVVVVVVECVRHGSGGSARVGVGVRGRVWGYFSRMRRTRNGVRIGGIEMSRGGRTSKRGCTRRRWAVNKRRPCRQGMIVTRKFVLVIVNLAMGMFAKVSVEIFAKRGGVTSDLAVFEGVPDGDVFVDMGESLAGDGIDGCAVGVLVLACVFLALWMFFEILVEVATEGSGVAGYLAVFMAVPDGDVFCGLGGCEGFGVHGGEGEGRGGEGEEGRDGSAEARANKSKRRGGGGGGGKRRTEGWETRYLAFAGGGGCERRTSDCVFSFLFCFFFFHPFFWVLGKTGKGNVTWREVCSDVLRKTTDVRARRTVTAGRGGQGKAANGGGERNEKVGA